MRQGELFPKVSVEFLQAPDQQKDELFLYNPGSNKGFALSGFAALICRKFTGEQSLDEITTAMELEHKLKKGTFDQEIEELIADLEKNQLIIFYTEASLGHKYK